MTDSAEPARSSAPSPAVPMRRGGRVLLAMCLATVALTALDLLSKNWMLERLSRPPAVERPVCQPDDAGRIRMQRVPTEHIELVPGYLEFRYAENCGAAFGMLRTAPTWMRNLVFGVAALAACVWLGLAFWRGYGGRPFAWAVPLVLSGALGNLVDRIRFGYVVDFIRFHLENRWEYPTFNVADVTITIGVALLLLDGLRKPSADPGSRDVEAPAPGSEA